jgi:23S rRNA (uracil1939-C5)-methyltransferase
MEITIEKLVYGGEGLAHHQGSAVFVPFVLPAERIAAATVEQKKKFIRARVERLLEPSPDRAEPRCPFFGVCGGCDYQHIPYETQLAYKGEILRETLRRLGRIEWQGQMIVRASEPWGYRNRAQWKVRPANESAPPKSDGGEKGDAGKNPALGYFRANSTSLCAVDDCAILSPLLLKSFLALRKLVAEAPLAAKLREIEAFATANDTRLLLTTTFASFPARAAELAELFRQAVPEIDSLLIQHSTGEPMKLYGPGFIFYQAAGRSYRVGHFSFFQVNRFLADRLSREVVEQEEGSLALDLFAGVGLFTLPLAERFQKVIAVESNPAAARDLEVNLATAGGSSRVEVHATDVERFLEKFKGKPELVVVDPPRAGLQPEMMTRLAQIAPARITYVSCDPPTLARDLAALTKSGYELHDVRLFDFFPQTFHMETVARLRRPS